MTVITRFAPSPTGFLHIGGARTALYNWLFAKHHAQYGSGGSFLLRIEDTDRKRSNEEAITAIYAGLSWLGLDWQGEVISQFSNIDRHVQIAKQLLDNGKAYKCYCTPDELHEMRELALQEGRSMRYDGRWRDRDPSDAPEGIAPVIRMKATTEGDTVINDSVQGEVKVANNQLDDMILLRADGTPTYMLAVVVDDHDMEVTHVIRGDDHLTNAFRQKQIYSLLGWNSPVFAHIPLIHGADGTKLSKRHGALGVEEYRKLGFTSDAICNYLLRLGWGHGNDEIITREQAIEWFSLEKVGRGAARFDINKLTSINGYYIRQSRDKDLINLIMPLLKDTLGKDFSKDSETRLKRGIGGLKERAKTINDLLKGAEIYVRLRPFDLDENALKFIDDIGLKHLENLRLLLSEMDSWKAQDLKENISNYSDSFGTKLGKVTQPLRAALSGGLSSPSLFEVMEIIGRNETLGRIDDILNR